MRAPTWDAGAEVSDSSPTVLSPGKLSAAAATWTFFLTGALGAFSIGGPAFLPSELAKLDGRLHFWATGLLFAAFLCGLVVRHQATLVMQVVPRRTFTDGERYCADQSASNVLAARQLHTSQMITSGALLLLMLGVLPTTAQSAL